MTDRYVLERADLDDLKYVMVALSGGRYHDEAQLKELAGKIEFVLRRAQDLIETPQHSSGSNGGYRPLRR